MSRSAGPGSPLWFRCRTCRNKETCWDTKTSRGWSGRVVLTGKKKTRRRASVRHGTVSRQYKCLDCKSTGWSAHNDLKRKEENEQEEG